mgnify:CR=1 FL=1
MLWKCSTRQSFIFPKWYSFKIGTLILKLIFFFFQVYPGIILGNGETIQNVEYLRKIGVTHVLNTAERHVPVNPAKYPLHGISYFGFHVDDHPMSNLSRFFGRTTDFIEEAMNRSGLIGKFLKVAWIWFHHLHLQWKSKLWAKVAWEPWK